MNNIEKIAAYNEIADLLRRHAELVRGTTLDVISNARALAKYAELSELFGFEVTTAYSGEMSSLGGWVCLTSGDAHAIEGLMLMGEGHNRTISWSDDGRQPDDEWLYCIGFSAGAYYFGDHYLTELFAKFWSELVELKPKYSDTANKNLYFSPENASLARKDFHRILEEYRCMVADDERRMRKEKLLKELEKLEEHDK